MKLGLRDAINDLLAPIRQVFLANTEFQEIEKEAYPPIAPVKKEKKQKKVGSKYPGAADQAKEDQAKVGASVEDAIETFQKTSVVD